MISARPLVHRMRRQQHDHCVFRACRSMTIRDSKVGGDLCLRCHEVCPKQTPNRACARASPALLSRRGPRRPAADSPANRKRDGDGRDGYSCARKSYGSDRFIFLAFSSLTEGATVHGRNLESQSSRLLQVLAFVHWRVRARMTFCFPHHTIRDCLARTHNNTHQVPHFGPPISFRNEKHDTQVRDL